MNSLHNNQSLTGEPPKSINTQQKIASAIGLSGLFILFLAAFNVGFTNKTFWLTLSLITMAGGTIWFAKAAYRHEPEGIKNNGIYFKSLTSRGLWAWLLGIGMTLFYIILYWFPQYLGYVEEGENTGVIALFNPLSLFISGNPASQWFLYGTLYTLAILIFGVKFIWKYRHNRYEMIRTCSVMFFQLSFAFFIPELLIRLNQPYYDFKNVWPLNYDLFADYKINEFISAGNVGTLMLIFGVISVFVITPILTYKYGKRWYCSWVCGCGGLAETAGDSFRHLSDKREVAWKVERWVVHSVVVFVTVMTTAVVFSYLRANDSTTISQYSALQDKVVILHVNQKEAIKEKIATVQQAGANGIVFVYEDASQKPAVIESMEDITIEYAIVEKEKNQQTLKNIEKGQVSTLVSSYSNIPDYTVAKDQELVYYNNLWVTPHVFIWSVIGLLTLVFTWVMVYKREQLAKDATYGAIGYFVVVMSILLFTYFSSPEKLFFFDAYQLRKTYGFIIGAMFSGVIGVGFYPIFGNRVWCRFGCPMAAILGFQQRLFSRFRITTNGGQCISCGNCSTYCEMGIDVRAYAQKGENIVRSSCVGCGICSAVCPRGVLKLENDNRKGRIESNEILLGNNVDLMEYVNGK